MHNPVNSNDATIHAAELTNPRARRKSARLSDAALILLSHAASRDDGMVLPPPAALRARGSALTVLLTNLLERALVQEVAVEEGKQSWRSDGEVWIGLRISADGLRAIGIEPESEVQSDTADAGQPETTASDGLPIETGDANEIAGRADRDAAGSTASAPRARRISKQDQIVAMLCLADGASIDTLMATTNWLPHTVRAALSGLRKKGHLIARRQSDEGTSVYFITTPSPATVSPSELS